MNYLSAESLSKSYGDKYLFQNLNFGVSQGQRIALVGINGSGKSTLLKILAGLIPPDTGSVSTRKGIKVGYLGQQPVFDEALTVEQTIFATGNPILEAIQDYEHCLADPHTSGERMQQVMDKMEHLKAWDYEVKIRQILSRLGVHNLQDVIGHLSGG